MQPFALHSRAAFAVFFPSVVRIEGWSCTLEEIIAMIIHAKQKQTREGENEIILPIATTFHFKSVILKCLSLMHLWANMSLCHEVRAESPTAQPNTLTGTRGDLSRDEF